METLPRRRRGTGTIDVTRRGTFRPRLPGAGDRLSECATYDEASRLLDAAIVVLQRTDIAKPGGHTLGAWGLDWLDSRERTRGIELSKNDRSIWRCHVAGDAIAELPLTSITTVDVREWLGRVRRKNASKGQGHKRAPKKPLGRQTIQNALNALRVCLEDAVEAGQVKSNPARDVRVPRGVSATHDPWTYLTQMELLAIMADESIAEGLRLLIAFAVGTGMRQGEMWNLRLVDVSDTHITVRYGSKNRGTKGRRIRRIRLFGIALDAWRAWQPMLARQRNPEGLAWPTPQGSRRGKSKPPRGWARAKASALQPAALRHDGRDVRWHDLRHTCASLLISGAWGRYWSLEELRDLLGHRSIKTTERYAHMLESVLDRAAMETMPEPEHLSTDLSTIYPRSPESVHESLQNKAPPARIGLATFGLGNPGNTEEFRELTRLRGAIVGLSARASEVADRLGEAGSGRLVAALLMAVMQAGDDVAKSERDEGAAVLGRVPTARGAS